MKTVFLFLRINTAEIGYFKFLLEGYDGLAVLTTIDVTQGLVRLVIPVSRYPEVIQVLENLAVELQASVYA